MYLRYMHCTGVNCNQLQHSKVKWWTVVNVIMKHYVIWRMKNFLTKFQEKIFCMQLKVIFVKSVNSHLQVFLK